MKRKGNLYKDIYKLENIEKAFNEVCKNITNKKKANTYKEYKGIYITRIYNTLVNREYEVGEFNTFVIKEPKERLIVSRNSHDKVIDHLVANILLPSICTCLIDTNIVARKGMGTSLGWKLNYEYMKKYKIKYGTYYILKFDISRFFSL